MYPFKVWSWVQSIAVMVYQGLMVSHFLKLHPMELLLIFTLFSMANFFLIFLYTISVFLRAQLWWISGMHACLRGLVLLCGLQLASTVSDIRRSFNLWKLLSLLCPLKVFNFFRELPVWGRYHIICLPLPCLQGWFQGFLVFWGCPLLFDPVYILLNSSFAETYFGFEQNYFIIQVLWMTARIVGDWWNDGKYLYYLWPLVSGVSNSWLA